MAHGARPEHTYSHAVTVPAAKISGSDSVEEHVKWIEDVNDTQNCDLQFPIVADADRKVAELYEMIHAGESETAAVRSVFIIDPNKNIRLTMTYPMAVGRNFDEILHSTIAHPLTDGIVLNVANKVFNPCTCFILIQVCDPK